MRVVLFASHKETFGPLLDVRDVGTVADLLALLDYDFLNAHPPWRVCRVAVNQSFAEPETMLHPSDEIAIIPPVSGG